MLPFIVFRKFMFLSWNDKLTAKWQNDQVDTREGVTYMFRQLQSDIDSQYAHTVSSRKKRPSRLMYRQHEAKKTNSVCILTTRNRELVFRNTHRLKKNNKIKQHKLHRGNKKLKKKLDNTSRKEHQPILFRGGKKNANNV